ncbi:uroporphyrinogen-III synthase [Tateyamaria pelophila]|uniref:uroporphyrinogen-III synthase n=1 Tax=Tateyamaria pelophila TaxID=328415 RepID=UPI001CBC7B82|nr:uroporphyrinogen-III synthase [Tateyamaria pelophila]
MAIRAQVHPVYSPLITISGLGNDPKLLADDAAIFTSVNGVAHGPEGHGRSAYCVGSATTKAARDRGWRADLRGETADELVTDLVKTPPSERLVHLSGVHTRGNICARLNEYGMQAQNFAVYDQKAQNLSEEARKVLARRYPVIAPLFSPRTSAQFAREVPRSMHVHAIVFSNAVAQNLDQASYATVTVSSAPNFGAMLTALATVLSDLPAG